MKKYLKLLAYEIENSKRLIGILVLGVIMLQSVAFWQMIFTYKKTLQQVAETQGGAFVRDVVLNFGTLVYKGWFTLSIMGSAVLIFAYIFYIWFKEWYKQGKSIYRLLMLPGSRMNVYWAKFTAIFIIIAVLLGVEVILLTLFMKIGGVVIGEQLVGTGNNWYVFIQNSILLRLVYPNTWMKFLLTYGIGVCLVSTCFQIVILAMSTRQLRTIQSLGAMVLNIVLVGGYLEAARMIVTNLSLTNGEMQVLITAVLGIYFIINTLISRHLLNHSIAV